MALPSVRVLITFLLFIAAVSVCAQDSSLTLRVDVRSVSVDVGVQDASGHPLTSLTAEDFTVYEDGQSREIKSFSSVDTPYRVLALFDCTGSTREAWPFLLKSLNGFVASLRPQDTIGVLAFGGGTTVILDWTSRSTEPLNIQMKMPLPLCDQTDFYGALAKAASTMRELPGKRKGVIVFSDGVHGGIPSRPVKVGGTTLTRFVDPSDDPGFLAVKRQVERSDTVFYFIAVNTDGSPANVDAPNLNPGTEYTPLSLYNLQEVRSRMQQIAQVSGGRIVVSQRNSDTGVLFEQIVRELGTLYSLAFTPESVADGKFHRIEVRVRGNDMQVRQSRDGFYAR